MAGAPTPSLLRVHGLGKQFGGLWALRDVDVRVDERQIRGLIGPNGAGKTTLLNIIAGTFPPSAGTVEFNGQSVTGRPSHEAATLGIARTFQHLTLFNGMTVIENVMTGLHWRVPSVLDWRRKDLASEGDAWRAARQLLERFGLDAMAAREVDQLSVAQRKRVELVRALALKPRLLLLDEPAAGLSIADVADLMRTLRMLRDQGLGVLLVEHAMDFVMEICDRLTVLDFGEVLADGTPADIQKHPQVIEAYLGMSHA